MNVIEAIRTRRSIGKVTQEPVAKEMIEQILEAGTWAPNHRLTEPWQFFVMSGEGRNKLGQALAAIATSQAGEDADAAVLETKAADAMSKARRSPVVIGVAVVPVERRDVIELEEYGAVFAAIQNMLLTVNELGLGAVWRTGEPCFHPLMNEAFGLRPQDKMLGFIYLGVPDMTPTQGKRSAAASKTTWIEA
ncbi:nitroreductase [Paenibacillus rhizovicinus]|uniref:Putative NAD(P)H nitroreductase n=1 Tax=Paenibacillus rhizovicinus TaxID=2704463 RepID=A0A6C0NWB4_9BACL|nr:nitroreductase [Paenibacillus rhizovicinus]QHW30500.1 nitroreductase [Paenibacillus rhizovicinus]